MRAMTETANPAAGAGQGRTGQARPARQAQEGRGDRRPARPRADPLRRLAVQRQGDGFLEIAQRRHLPPRLQGAALVVGGVDTQQRAVPGSAGQDRRRDRGRGLWRPVDGAGAAPQRRRRRRAGARRFRRRRLDAQRRHDLGRHQSRQGPGRQEPDRRGVRAQEGRADGRRRRFAHRAGGHHRPREASSAACTGTAASSAPGRPSTTTISRPRSRPTTNTPMPAARWCRASASAR